MLSYESVASLLQQFSAVEREKIDKAEPCPESEEADTQPDPLAEPKDPEVSKVDAADALEIANFDNELEQMM